MKKINKRHLREIIREVINEEYGGGYYGTAEILKQMKQLSHKLIGAVNKWELQQMYGDNHSNADTAMADMNAFALQINNRCKELLDELNSVI